MSIIFYLFIAFVALSVLVFFHELGHFMAARFFGVKVERFSIGFGKIIARKHCCSTEWVFSAIPLGGYVKMKGQDDSDPTAKSPDNDSYNIKKPWQRIIILLAGPMANFILAFFVYLIIAISGAPTVVAVDYLPPVISEVQKDSPAQKAGLAAGDTILAVNNAPIKYWYEIGESIRASNGDITIKLNRDNISMEFILQTKITDGTNEFMEKIQRKIIGIQTNIDRNMTIDFSMSEALFYAYNETKKASILIATGVKKMATGEVDAKHVGGAITIFDVIMKFAEKGIVYLLFIMALISVNLGVLNLLPIPALDGGHIAFNLYEMITRREPSESAMYYLTLLGWAVLFGLMGLGLYNDINRLWGS
ncbi:MAG TPA: RIP metalloprotease RseP [Sulfurovum sp.]|nr:RIP metalloprotease RseP [Sulfurovum sp.]